MSDTNLNRPHLRGVNLGAWLLLEKWMVPSVFEDLAATDETSWCVELGAQASDKLHAHWNSFVTRQDFAWLASIGINAVRIPVGHWIFGGDYPYHRSYGARSHPYVEGGIEVLDRAFAWAREFDMHVVLDLHAAPGCQNGFDNGGIMNVCEWHMRDEYLQHSLDVLEKLAQRYRNERCLHAIEVLNEPRWDVPTAYLENYYRLAYARIRKHCTAENVAVIFHDGFRSHREFVSLFSSNTFDNAIFDIHRYQCFDRADIDMDIYGHINKAAVTWSAEANAIHGELKLPAIAGEWSLGLDLKVVSLWAPGPYNHALEHMDEFQQDTANRAYGSAQLMTFEKYRGWFFWSYKTETTPAWCFRDCVERGWLPAKYG